MTGIRKARSHSMGMSSFRLAIAVGMIWIGPGRGRKSTRPGANGVVELSPFEFLDRLADLVPPPNRPPTTPRDAKGQTHGPGGRGVSFCVPGVWWRHPTQRRRPAGAGSLRTGGSQAGEGQDGFARVKITPGTSRRTARTTARLAGPRATGRLGRARSGPRRPGNLSGTDRRTARDRHPQPLTGSHATVRTARKKSGFKTGSSRREKSDLERG